MTNLFVLAATSSLFFSLSSGSSLSFLLDTSSKKCWTLAQSTTESFQRICALVELYDKAREPHDKYEPAIEGEDRSNIKSQYPIFIEQPMCQIIRDVRRVLLDYYAHQKKRLTQFEQGSWTGQRKSRYNYAASLLYHLQALHLECDRIYPMYPKDDEEGIWEDFMVAGNLASPSEKKKKTISSIIPKRSRRKKEQKQKSSSETKKKWYSKFRSPGSKSKDKKPKLAPPLEGISSDDTAPSAPPLEERPSDDTAPSDDKPPSYAEVERSDGLPTFAEATTKESSEDVNKLLSGDTSSAPSVDENKLSPEPSTSASSDYENTPVSDVPSSASPSQNKKKRKSLMPKFLRSKKKDEKQK